MAVELYIVRRPFTMEGRSYSTGEKVRLAHLSEHKLAQLVEHRYLSAPMPSMVAARNRFLFAGHTYNVGDPFSLKGLKAEKVAQLLEHRFIQPQPMA